MRIAVTADLHWGALPPGDAATRALAAYVAGARPDLLIIAGDIGEGEHFGACLALFARLECPRLLVPGNHDLWTRVPGGSSLELYEHRLPGAAREHGFHYLDHAPYLGPEAGVAIAGSINWYDYSFADPALEREYPDAPLLYRRKLFPRGRHNDGRFVHLGMDDGAFTTLVVERFQRHLAALPPETPRVIVVQHHPPIRELFYPVPAATIEQRFWLAYTGNRRMQEVVLGDPRIELVACGHTHAHCAADVQGKRCVNIGGDYDWKRLLILDTSTGAEEWLDFGDPRA